MPSPTNVRFPEPVDRQLAAYARKVGAKKSTVVIRALREWLRMQAHPGITFVATVTGQRRAALSSGPQVWTIAAAWQQQEPGLRNPAVLAQTLGLTPRDIETALAYWSDHRDEIDELVDRHHVDQDEALAAWERRRALDAV